MLDASTADSVGDSGNRRKAGFSIRASAVRPGRDNEPVVSSREFDKPHPSGYKRTCWVIRQVRDSLAVNYFSYASKMNTDDRIARWL